MFHRFTTIAAFVVLPIGMLCAADFSNYRGLQFGMTLPAAAAQTGATASGARLIHTRPAMIQELDWQPRVETSRTDPVKEGLLTFVNGELYRIAVTYDRYKIEGMTAKDLTDAISATYGPPTTPVAEIPFHSNYAEVATVLARWEDAEYSYNLIHTGDQASFAMVLYSKRLNALAQIAIAESVRLDAKEAPQRELDKQKLRANDERLALEKARSLNKPNFRP